MAVEAPNSNPIWPTLGFLVGLPLLSAAYSTLTSWMLIDLLGGGAAFGYFFGHALVPWLLSALLTWGWMGLLARWRPHHLALAALGGCTASLLILPLANAFAHMLPARALAVSGASADGVIGTLAAFLRAFVLWMAANYVSDRFLNYRPFRYGTSELEAPTGPAQPAALAKVAAALSPSFLSRLTRATPINQLLALKAEQHYIKVISTARASGELVLYRLTDAIRELPEGFGLQVHRSWWVSQQAIAAVRDEGGRKLTLVLTNGLEVPVSSPYQAMTRRWLRNFQPDGRPATTLPQQQVVEDRPGQ